jgi:putative oxidoreductase
MFCRCIPNKEEVALSIVRITLGVIFTLHAAQKVLGLFGGPGLEGFAKWAGGVGIPSTLAYAAAIVELIGGLMLLCGIAAEIGALLVIAVMIGAIWFVHGKSGFFVQNGGYEYALSLIMFSLAIVIGGPGKWYALCTCKLTGCSCKSKK